MGLCGDQVGSDLGSVGAELEWIGWGSPYLQLRRMLRDVIGVTFIKSMRKYTNIHESLRASCENKGTCGGKLFDMQSTL